MGQGEKYTDERLLMEMRQEGVDVVAYERLFHRYYPMVFNFTKAMVKSPAIAEDIAQNSFMKLWVNRFTLQPDLSVKNYLYVIARNEAINYLRSAQTKNVGLGVQQEAHHQEPTIDDWMSYAETNTLIKNNIEALPPQRRTIFKMSRYDHMSNIEIAVKLNLSVRTVEKHIELALKDLRRSMS